MTETTIPNNLCTSTKRSELERLFGQWVLVQKSGNRSQQRPFPRSRLNLTQRHQQRIAGAGEKDNKNCSVDYHCTRQKNRRLLGFIPAQGCEQVAHGGFVARTAEMDDETSKNNTEDHDNKNKNNFEQDLWLELVRKPHQTKVTKIECQGNGLFLVSVVNHQHKKTTTTTTLWELDSAGTKLTETRNNGGKTKACCFQKIVQ